MTFSLAFLAIAVSWLALIPSVLAGFNPNSNQNRAVYWGNLNMVSRNWLILIEVKDKTLPVRLAASSVSLTTARVCVL